MRLFLYSGLLATQVIGAVAFARAARGHQVAILNAEGARPLTPAGGWIRSLGATTAAALMVTGLVTQRWIGWDIGVMVTVLFFLMEVRRLKAWKGPSKIFICIVCAFVMLFSIVDLLTHV